MNKKISVITRASDLKYKQLLFRSMLSVHTSEFEDIEHIIVTKNLNALEIKSLINEINNFLPKIYGIKRKFLIKNLNFGIKDSRTEALNIGVKAASGRFLAFLDHDDIIYPSAYGKAINELINTKADIVIGKIKKVRCGISNQMLYAQEKQIMEFPQYELAILKDNIIPIHGFVINRDKIQNKINFNTELTALEDYYFLYNILLEDNVSFIEDVLGEYWFYPDNRNTTSGILTNNLRYKKQWEKSRKILNKFKEERKFSFSSNRLLKMIDELPFSDIISQKNQEINNQKINLNKYQLKVKQFETNYAKNLFNIVNVIQKYPEGLGDLVVNIYKSKDVEFIDAETKILNVEIAIYLNEDRAYTLDVNKITDKHVRIALPKSFNKTINNVVLLISDGHISFKHKVFSRV